MVHVLPATWFDIGCINIRAAQATMNCAIVPAANSCSSLKGKVLCVIETRRRLRRAAGVKRLSERIQEMDVLIDPLF